jgi:3-hydroxybutyryl-CoA dehydrogenase
MQIKKVGVIGAGQMGNGIAHVLSLGGYNVVLNDIDNTYPRKSLTYYNK